MITKFVSRVLIIAMIPLMIAGCGKNGDQPDTGEQASAKVPRLSFHLPGDLLAAVNRLQEIHQAVTGPGPLPEPVKVDYVEVIHGEGASAHSHFFLASEFQESGDGHGHHHDHHDGEVTETIRRGTYEVDFRTELKDLIAKLPENAATTDLEEADWDSVRDISTKLSGVIESVPDSADDSGFRQAWTSRESEITGMLAKIAEISKKAGGESP